MAVLTASKECKMLMRGNIETAATLLAHDDVVNAHHVVTQLGEHRTVPTISTTGRAVLLYTSDPPYGVVPAKPEARTGKRRWLGLVCFIEKLALVQRHTRMIPGSTDPSQRPHDTEPSHKC